MKTIKKIFAIALVVILILSIVPINAFASDKTGYLSETISWNFNDNTKTLTISGAGEIPVIKENDKIPWFNYKDDIKKVIISEGITSVCETVWGLTNVVSLSLPKTLTKILSGSFDYYKSLETINIPKKVTSIVRAFDGCDNLKHFTIDGKMNAETDKFYDVNDINNWETGQYYFVRDGVLFLNCRYIGGYYLDETQNQLVKYPSGKTNDTYAIPDNVPTVLTYAFEEGMKLKRLIIPSSVKTMLMSAIGYHGHYGWEEVKPIDVVFQHDHYPAETDSTPYYGFTWGLANLFEGSRVIVKNEEVKKEFESHYDMDDISNSFIYDANHAKNVSIVVEPNPTTSFSVDKTIFNFSLDDYVKNYNLETGEYKGSSDDASEYEGYKGLKLYSERNYAQVNVTREPMDTTDSINYTIKSQEGISLHKNITNIPAQIESINDSDGNPLKDSKGNELYDLYGFPIDGNKSGVVTIDDFGRIHPTGAIGTAVVTVSSGEMSEDITINVTCSHLITQTQKERKNTCEKEGYTKATVCRICGTVLSGLETLPKLEHDYVLYSKQKEPTCTDDGHTAVYRCKNGCGDTYGGDIIPSLGGHTYSTDIYGYRRCSRCGELDYEYYATHPLPTPDNPNHNTTTKPSTTPNNNTNTPTKPSQAPTSTVTTTTASSKVTKPKKTKLKSVKGSKKALTVAWGKASGVNGYQIQIATDKKFKKNKKTITIKKQKTTKTTIKKLKAKKKYYVRIRTYKTVKGKKVYSSWSSVKSVKTK